jgi:hypothetical protein
MSIKEYQQGDEQLWGLALLQCSSALTRRSGSPAHVELPPSERDHGNDRTPLVSAFAFGCCGWCYQIVLPMIRAIGPYWFQAPILAALMARFHKG